MKRLLERLRRALRGKDGYSIAESLLALLIVALLSTGIATGVAFGVRQYNEAMTLSEARVLCSTLASVVRGELSNVTSLWTDGETVIAFPSYHYASGNQSNFYAAEVTETNAGRSIQVKGDYGEIVVAPIDDMSSAKLVLSSAAYSKYKLQANVHTTWTGNLFNVTIRVRTPDGTERASETFQVIPLNRFTPTASS